MSTIKYFFSLLLFLALSAQAQDEFGAADTEQPQDALQTFRQLLSHELNPNRATIERVFNPIGEGQSLLVRAYVTGPEELIYRPLFQETDSGNLVTAAADSFILRALPGTELKEVLINYQADKKHYELFFGSFRYSVSPDMSDVSHISARPEAAPFLSQNFQTLFVDHPSAALGIRYLFDRQSEEGKAAIIQLKKEYRDSTTGALMVTSDGDILNRYRFELYEAIHVEPVYFLEQRPLDNNSPIRYYIQPDGLQSYYLNDAGTEQAGDWIPRHTLQKARLIQPAQR